MDADRSDTVGVRTRRPERVHVCRDTTPGEHATDTDDIVWWLPVLGPTAIVLAQTLARHTPLEGRTWNVTQLAMRIGLAGNVSKLWASLQRLEQFGAVHFHATDVVTVRMSLPALSPTQLERLPADMATDYERRRSMSDER